VVTHQLQVERRTGKVRRPETDVLPLCHATKYVQYYNYSGTACIQQPTRTTLLVCYRHLLNVTKTQHCVGKGHLCGYNQQILVAVIAVAELISD